MSVVGRPGYKETGVGWIPHEWKVHSLEELSADSITYGVVQPGPELPNGVPLVRGGDVKDGRISKTLRTISDDVSNQFARTVLRGGEMLVSLVGYPGETAIASSKLAGANIARQVGLVRLNDKVLPHYVQQYLASPGGKKVLLGGMIGSAQQVVNLSALRKVDVPVPPLPEQQKIAAILTAVDDKLDVIGRQISSTQTLKQGLMQTLFTRGAGTPDTQGRWHPHTAFQDTELGRTPVGWKVTTLEQVAHVERGKFSARPRNDPRYFEAGDIPFIQTGDIAGATRYVSKSSQFINEEGLSVSRLFPVGTIFITIAANIGDVAMAKMPMACPDSLVGILPSSALCDGMWLYFLLKSSKEYFDSQSTQNAQKNINLQVLRPFAFGLPPLTEQAQIAGYLSSVDDKLDTLTTKHTHYQTLKRGLMQKLLTGEWRVKVDASLVNS